MSGQFNKTIIIGRLCEDPTKLREELCRFPIVFTEHVCGEERTVTQQVFAYGKQAEICVKHLSKGDLCCIEGRLEYDKNTKTVKSIVAERITFLSTKRREQQKEEETKNEQE